MAKPPQQELARSMANQVASAMGSVPNKRLGQSPQQIPGIEEAIRNSKRKGAVQAKMARGELLSFEEWLEMMGGYTMSGGRDPNERSVMQSNYQRYVEQWMASHPQGNATGSQIPGMRYGG